MRAGRTAYSSGRGEHGLWTPIAKIFCSDRAKRNSGELICLPGTQTALFAVMTGLTNAGDGVLTRRPAFMQLMTA